MTSESYDRPQIVAICGSASRQSGNLAILQFLAELCKGDFQFEVIDDLSVFPHFRTDLTDQDVPEKIATLRKKLQRADGILICTPEYVFSLPSGLKNIIEWCVSTTVLSGKPAGLITASASGEKAHEELKLIMQTVQTRFTDATTLLIQGVKGKVAADGQITDERTRSDLIRFSEFFKALVQG